MNREDDVPDEKSPVQKIAEATGGTIESEGRLPDGSGFATMSTPLPKDHWIYGDDEYEPSPMPFRMGTDDPRRKAWKEGIWQAGMYAVRGATMKGTVEDFDPDALVQNLVVGMLGYATPDALSDDDFDNPDPPPEPHPVESQLLEALAKVTLELDEARAEVDRLRGKKDSLAPVFGDADTRIKERLGSLDSLMESDPVAFHDAVHNLVLDYERGCSLYADSQAENDRLTVTVATVKAWTVEECSKKTPDEWKKGYAGAAHDVRRSLDSPVEPVRVTVEEADGYVCRLRVTDKDGASGVVAYCYSYWAMMCPNFKPGDTLLFVKNP